MNSNDRGGRRILAADIAKGLGILSVFLGHCHKWPTEMAVYSFHMPLFFIISGWCSSFSSDMTSLKVRTVRLMFRLYIPIIAVLATEGVIDILRQMRSLGECVGVMGFLASKLAQCAFLFSTRTEYFGVLFESSHVMWFLTALIVGRTLIDLLHLALNKVSFRCTVIALTFAGMYLGKNGVHLPLGLEAGMAAQIYLFVGAQIKSVRLGSVRIFLVSTVAWLSLVVWIQATCGGRFSMCDGTYPHLFLSVACAILGSVAVISLSSLIERWGGKLSSILASLGIFTLDLLLVHEFEYLYLAPFYSASLWLHFLITLCIVIPLSIILRRMVTWCKLNILRVFTRVITKSAHVQGE